MRATLVLSLSALAACTEAKPAATGAVCPSPDPLTIGYSTAFDPMCTPVAGAGSGDCFGKVFMDKYCVQCHASTLKLSMRNGAPLFHDFDQLETILEVPDHIDQYAGAGPNAANHFMPGARCPSTPGGPLAIDCPQPTDEERQQLSVWLACARARTYNFRPAVDAGVADAPTVDAGSGSGSAI